MEGNQAKIVSVGHRDSVKEAAAKMFSHNVGCLIVNDDQGKFIGLVTERDIARHVAVSPESGAGVEVAQIMTDHVVSCAPGITAGEARKIMAEHRIRHLPIVANGAVVGILSARDIMGQQLLEDRAAAEEVAMLSKCLKSIDLAEAVEIVADGIAEAVRRQQLRSVPLSRRATAAASPNWSAPTAARAWRAA